ncbi:MAG TPA: hypothetical protein VK171_09575 [Fimbriimonas sp.]|nr:hypothetical protein [Fimbriimonas sp.]
MKTCLNAVAVLIMVGCAAWVGYALLIRLDGGVVQITQSTDLLLRSAPILVAGVLVAAFFGWFASKLRH